MLETCGMFFNRGAAGKKLDYFLSFFQVRLVRIDHLMAPDFTDPPLLVLCPYQGRHSDGY